MSPLPPPLSFRQQLEAEFRDFVVGQNQLFPAAECLRVDLHCHDHNSDVPDELWGRLLGLPETWLKTGALVKCLRRNGSDVITVTNHNNARSCWALRDAGEDVLVGAEFTCLFPEYGLYLHILTYGFTPEQEVVLKRKRRNVYDFVRYCAEHDIPLVLPHPLYFYTSQPVDLELFEKLALMFQRFEVLNGQRDRWQSVLALHWLKGLDAEKLDGYRRKHALDPADFGVDLLRPKILTGGSDDHMGLTAGTCGSRLHVPNLAQRTEPLSVLALEALRAGRVVPYGTVGENQRLNAALLDYFAQIVTHMQDPGLLRMLLHRGETSDKLACLAIGNALLEFKKHKRSRKFISLVHDALHGKKMNRILKWNVSRDYRFCVTHLERIAEARKQDPQHFEHAVSAAVGALFTGLSELTIRRLRKSLGDSDRLSVADLNTATLTRRFEIPLQFTALAYGEKPHGHNISGVNLGDVLDNLSFPVLMMAVLAGTQLASTHALYKQRPFLNRFAEHLGTGAHQKRALYLTDTLLDRNGVSNSLSGKLAEIRRRDLPIDFLICHADAEPGPHLQVLRPLTEFSVPGFGEQPIRIPDLLEIARVFYEGGYDRVVCSTEGPMVLVALFLKFMFNVPAHFFMHTDWLDFIRHTTDLDAHERDRIRRLLRALYQQFDGVFVLNSEHQRWLGGEAMGLDPARVHLTAHHVEPPTASVTPVRKSELFPGANKRAPVLLTAGRLSAEKGVLELPALYARLREAFPDLRWVIAGTGPAESQLRAEFPEAHFTGWIDRARLNSLYAGLDLFVFPSRFDTFGNVVLEAFAQGMPVLAYDCKGPADIVQPGRNGYLVDSQEAMAAQIIAHLRAPERHPAMREAARARVADYQAGPIMRQFLADLGLPFESAAAPTKAALPAAAA